MSKQVHVDELKQGDKVTLEIELLRSPKTGKIQRQGTSHGVTIPSDHMDNNGGFFSKLGYFTKIPFVIRETGEKGEILWYRIIKEKNGK